MADAPFEQPAEPGTELVPRQGPVRALPLGADPSAGGPLESPAEVSLVPAVAAAAGGFLLGVVTFVLVRILRRPKPARLRLGGRRGRKGATLDVAASRSFLVDVHLLDRR